MDQLNGNEPVLLTTKNAVEYLLDGTLRLKVCRYCLKVCSNLSNLSEILEIAIEGGLHEVTIHDMMASFYPFKVEKNTCFPNKICEECLTSGMKAYLFTLQCERAERAIRNCFEDVEEKYYKLDPLEPIRKRGKRKLNPNTNIIYIENKNVIEYAKPVINIINTNSVLDHSVEINTLECQKCWKILPSTQALVIHEESHPKTMWYNCKMCGKSFVKRFHLKQHIKKTHTTNSDEIQPNTFNCIECGDISKNLGKHYQHIEKHKFKVMLRNVINRRTDRLCVLCLEEGSKMTDLDEVVDLNGGYPDLNGEFSIKDILSSVFLSIPFINVGKKICEACLSHALNSYIFTRKLEHVKNRLNQCVTQLFNNLDNLNYTKKTVMIEISEDVILPMVDFATEDQELDAVEVLEDEFREEESNTESDISDISDIHKENPAKNVTKTYSRRNLVNGYKKLDNICNEFLTFKPKVTQEKSTNKSLFTCPMCNKYFISNYFLKKHVLKHDNVVTECAKCFKQFKSKFHLFEHIKIVHVLKSSCVSCEVCGRSYTSVNKLKLHQKSHLKKECHLCNKYYRNQKDFTTHLQRHIARYRLYNNKYKQSCSFCEKSCPNQNELSLHVNKIHIQMKPYNCDMCEKSFYTETNLNSHKKLHSLYSKENCMFCSKKFKCRRSLVIHVRRHIGMKPHFCPICRQTFYSESEMKKHMNMSHGGKYCCKLCKAVYKTIVNLRLHLSIAHSSM